MNTAKNFTTIILLHYYNIHDLSDKVCIPNKTEENQMEQNVIQSNGGTTINVDVSVQKVIYVKKIMFGILLPVIVEMENI